MPWHDNSGNGNNDKNNNGSGPWGQPPRNGSGGSGGRGPRRPGRGGGDGDPPDLEELLEASRARLKKAFPGRGGRGGGGGEFAITPTMFFAALVLLAFFWAASGIFQVGPQEIAVRTTFGKYSGTNSPGLNWHAPFIQSYTLVPVQQEQTTRAGYVGDTPTESLMLTSDRNIVDVSFTVNWKIRQGATEPNELPNAAKYVFNIEGPANTVKAVAEAAMRETIGGEQLDPILTSGQLAVNQETAVRIQEVLDEYDSGIEVIRVNIDRPEPPAAVRDAFAEVVRAGNEKQQMVNEATRDANQIVPVAEGQALKVLQDALAYSARVEAEANGQADRFNKIYAEYVKAPQVTRQRMYLETTEKVLSGMNKIVIDEQAGSGIVPYLPLNELTKKQGN